MGEKLGQNFLANKNIVEKIIKAADLQVRDLVLEIGPGKGILTEELVKHAGKVVTVEIDKMLSNLLLNKFSNKKVEIINEDILKISNFQSLISNKIPNYKNTKYKILSTRYKVVANIPYYITAPIIRKFLESDYPPSEMILMVQKEVAERIVAKPGQMSILAISVQYYAEPKVLFEVPRGNFDPVPEVDSAVIRITRNKKQETRNKEEVNNFFRVVRAGFCAKRKTLINNLANSFHLDKKEVEGKVISAGLKTNTRAQELSIADWEKLAGLFF